MTAVAQLATSKEHPASSQRLLAVVEKRAERYLVVMIVSHEIDVVFTELLYRSFYRIYRASLL